MNIGFDAKRAFHNNTGLGNYSRTLINGLANLYPEHEYFLFNPKPSKRFPKPDFKNVHELLPMDFFHKRLSSFWRSSAQTRDIKNNHIDVFHGLSGELPFGIQRSGAKAVVTIHDLIFERYPKQYGVINTNIYRKKFQYACAKADRVIAISAQTKTDLIDLYKIPEEKIEVCYQSCAPHFAEKATDQKKQQLRNAYHLPEQFFLYVGSIIERKNLLRICEGLVAGNITTPLVVVGNGKKYKEDVKTFLANHNRTAQVLFLSEKNIGDQKLSLNYPENLAALYQMALALVYPSIYEGFGIPVLEALWSGLPVITSNISCLPETGGDAAYYVDPFRVEELATALKKVGEDELLRSSMREKGAQHAQNFTLEKCTGSVMKVYQSL